MQNQINRLKSQTNNLVESQKNQIKPQTKSSEYNDSDVQEKIDKFKEQIFNSKTNSNNSNNSTHSKSEHDDSIEFDLNASYYDNKKKVTEADKLDSIGSTQDLLPNIVITEIKPQDPDKDKILKQQIENAKKNITYIPSSSIIEATLISGIDAPTHDNAKSEPHPALLQVKNIVNMPNFKSYNLDSCRVLVSCYGNLATQRVYFRTIKIACIFDDENHSSIDIGIKGNIIGNDGKLGIPGRLVSKNGQMLALSLATSIFSGVSDSLKPERNIQIATDTSTKQYQTPPMKTMFQGGVFSGLSSSAKTLSEYYLKLADQAHPVIEITPGKHCEIILTNGITLNFNK